MNMQMTHNVTIIGWDIGGAHVKAALIREGGLQQVIQMACPLWRGMDELVNAVHSVIKAWQLADVEVCHAITMTGELVDLFPNRQTGVIQIAETMQQQLSGECWYYQCNVAQPQFVSGSQLDAHWEAVASANWHASASLIAQETQSGLFIDIGSTTTDIIVMHQHRLYNAGSTDATRMRAGELLYTGVVRTPLMALGPTVQWRGAVQPLAAEYFATTADVYRMTLQLANEADMVGTADGGDKTTQATAIRLARMVGHDVGDYPMKTWQSLAEAIKAKQLAMIVNAVRVQLDRLLKLAPALNTLHIVSAGVGEFLVKEVIAELLQSGHYPEMQLNQSAAMLSNMHDQLSIKNAVSTQAWAGHCLPAVAVAILAKQDTLSSSV